MVYLGQHYVTDVIGGVVLAAGAWMIMTQVVVPLVPALRHQPAGAHEPGASGPSSTGPGTAEPDPAAEVAGPGPGLGAG